MHGIRSKGAVVLALLTLFVILPSCERQPGGTGSGPAIKLDSKVTSTVEEKMSAITDPVTLHLYRGPGKEKASDEMRALLDFMGKTSELVIFDEHSITEMQPGPATPDHGPVITFQDEENLTAGRNIYLGFPDGFELEPFLDGVLMASGQVPTLSEATEKYLKNLDRDVILRIFVTPT